MIRPKHLEKKTNNRTNKSTRPDIVFGVNRLVQFDNCKNNTTFAAERILRYLKGTMKFSLKWTKDISGNKNVVCGELKSIK